MLGNCALMGASSTERYSARRIAPISVRISTRHLQYFFYRLDIYFDRLGLICNHLRPCAFYAG